MKYEHVYYGKRTVIDPPPGLRAEMERLAEVLAFKAGAQFWHPDNGAETVFHGSALRLGAPACNPAYVVTL